MEEGVTRPGLGRFVRMQAGKAVDVGPKRFHSIGCGSTQLLMRGLCARLCMLMVTCGAVSAVGSRNVTCVMFCKAHARQVAVVAVDGIESSQGDNMPHMAADTRGGTQQPQMLAVDGRCSSMQATLQFSPNSDCDTALPEQMHPADLPACAPASKRFASSEPS